MTQNNRSNKRRPKANSGNSASNESSSNRNRPNPNNRRKKPARPGGNTRGQQRPSQKRKSDIDPETLIRKATATEEVDFRSDRYFADMPLDDRLKESLRLKGFERPSEIQDRTLETLLEGRDLLGIAQTGTGKTGAFLIPIIQKLLERPQKPYALVVVPTRELATQVDDEFQSMSQGLRLYSSFVIGGTNINRDISNLRKKSHVVIATPGRLLDLANRKAIDLREFNTLVLDEFDRMLDMGFVHDVKKIIHAMQQRKHTLLFSATLDKTQQSMINSILKNPETVKVSSGESTGDHIDQEIIRLADGEDKFQILCDMLKKDDFQKVLVFEETKHRVSRLCGKLNKRGIKSDQIHGNKSQNARQNALNAFKSNDIKVLVATDVAARGIDVDDVTHVINYQLPQTFDSYIHRIGRTGRAGRTGKAYTFVD